jgi:hypothetical protein
MALIVPCLAFLAPAEVEAVAILQLSEMVALVEETGYQVDPELVFLVRASTGESETVADLAVAVAKLPLAATPILAVLEERVGLVEHS